MSLGGSHMVSFGLGLAGRQASAEMVETLRRHAEPLPPPERAEEFGAFFDRYGDARVVLLGEATHGTSEFYRARAAITRQLVAHHGFNRSEEHTSELQSLMRISYAVFCLKKKKRKINSHISNKHQRTI